MLNKRISAIALSVLLAFSPMYSSVYGSAAMVSEGETVLEDTNALQDEVEAEMAETDDFETNEVLAAPVGGDDTNNDDPADPIDDDAANDDDPTDPANNGDDAEDICAVNGHSWDEGVTVTDATCTEEGTLLQTCTECGETRNEIISPFGHKFGGWTVVTPATTRKDGKSVRTCSECGATESKVVAHTILKVRSITISRSSATLLNGKTVQLWAKAAPSDATNTAVTWKSSNTSVATVTATGIVTAKRRGTATITCTAKDGGGAKASCKITVNLGVAKIALSRTSVSLNKGRTFTLKATVSPAAAANKAVTWKISNTKVATVSRTGKITAGAKGSCKVYVYAINGVYKTVSVTVR